MRKNRIKSHVNTIYNNKIYSSINLFDLKKKLPVD